jgi:hypothetical protein
VAVLCHQPRSEGANEKTHEKKNQLHSNYLLPMTLDDSALKALFIGSQKADPEQSESASMSTLRQWDGQGSFLRGRKMPDKYTTTPL